MVRLWCSLISAVTASRRAKGAHEMWRPHYDHTLQVDLAGARADVGAM